MKSPIEQFYVEQLPDAAIHDSVLSTACPFCPENTVGNKGTLTVFLNKSSFFYGYFRCSSGCVNGGFQHWFARLSGIDVDTVPGLVADDSIWQDIIYPQRNINVEIDDFQNQLSQEQLSFFKDVSITSTTLRQLKIGYNGRYLVYPYFQTDGNCYSARCVHPEKNDDFFWHGDVDFAEGPKGLFNIEELERCMDGTLFLCEGEENLLVLKQLGFPGMAYSERSVLDAIDPKLFNAIRTVFIAPLNSPESYASARLAASKIGFKVRILRWWSGLAKDYSLRQLSLDSRGSFGKKVGEMIGASKPFSPFASPEREYGQFFTTMADTSGEEYNERISGFPLLDSRIGGIHGINILGGGPKVGKSSFMIQVATNMAARQIPVLYYDFENGRQRIYQRTYSRLSRIETGRLHSADLTGEEKKRYAGTKKEFAKLLRYFRVINDRKVSPELMRHHIDFLRHECRHDYPVVVIDSLHKLPFKDLSEMRTGIDSWLRQMEAIRDEYNVAFLVVSELSRGVGGSYKDEPHMGIFKGSGDIEYSADNAMVLLPEWDHMRGDITERVNKLWLVGSREHSPGLVGQYILDYPFWGFREEKATFPEGQ